MAMAITMPLTLRNKLKTLCAHGWSYAIFWRFHPRNSLLLTVEEAYFEEHLGEEIANMLPQVHLLGEGCHVLSRIVGEAAFTGKHSWVHSDGQTHDWNLTEQNICEDDSGLHQQFSSGIKTIVVIPVKAWGVVQFGSRKKILERVEFLKQTQSVLKEIDDDMGMLDMSGNAVLPQDCEDLNGLLTSISSASPNNSFPFQYKTYEEAMASLQRDSFCLGDQLKGTMEAQVVLSDGDSAAVLLKPNSSMNSLIAKNSYFGACGGELSSFDLLEQQLVSDVRAQEVADVCFTNKNAFATSKLVVQDSALTSLCSMDRGSFQGKLQNSLDNQYSTQSSVVTDGDFPSSSNALLHGLSENIEPVDMSEEILKFSSMDDLCQWFAPSQEDSICKAVIALNNTFSESIEFNPTSFDMVGSSSLNDISVPCLARPNSNLDGKETSVVMHSTEKGILDSVELDFVYGQADEWWGNMLTPVVSGVTDAGFSECISELNTDTLTGTRKRLFSELGIEELLRGGANYNPFNSSEFECELSPKKRQKVESSSVNRNPIHFTNLHRPGAKADLMQPLCDLGSTNNLPSKKDPFTKLQAGMWIDDSHSINIGKAVPVYPQKPEEPPKPTKKRARPGESTRPRPKDRQQIQDCIKELRGIIPNGGKCSIDSLLDRTIRYMLFLQSVVKYADKLQEPNEPKANEVVLKDSGVADSKNCGMTWAYEVAHQTMLCPIIVEDMSLPGQMLIEMLCEEQDFFLEIIDIIRGFGLNILKAKMERRKKKLWARFIVEANRHVTRIDVFWSLIHLLQQTNTSGIDSSNKHCDVIDANI
ncbi:Transcription factor LHW, partial [Mucuna pruriens]